MSTKNAVFQTMGNKEKLMLNGGEAARVLLETGCAHVFVVWDLRPSWPNKTRSDCQSETKVVKDLLDKAGVPDERVTCICIKEELEAWLLADTAALQDFCGGNKKLIPSQGRVDHIDWPKSRVESIILERTHRKYAPHYHAVPILMKANRAKLRKVPSYKQFEDKLLELC
jgi:Domain of unknown function (DUF4276)